MPSLKIDSPLNNPGELEMRQRFPNSYFHWDEYSLSVMVREFIDLGLANFVEKQPFFFIATADSDGHCDANFRGANTGTLACKVIDEKTLIFPDYSGNGMYNSLGNILSNPHIGMIFIDFQMIARARINGKASIKNLTPEVKALWPEAQCYIEVQVEQAYRNCPARIPRMVFE